MSRRRKIMMRYLPIFNFRDRVIADGGTVEATECIGALDADTVMYPSGFKATKIYSQVGTDGVDDFTVDRASTKTRINEAGLIETLANDVLAPDYTNVGCPVNKLEPLSVNLYEDSELNNVENTTVTATPYTIFLYGTGTITFSGTFVGTLVGTGVNDKVEVTFTPSAGTLISTDSGSVDKKQIENLGYSTSYIFTSGGSATRLADIVKNGADVNSFNSAEGALYVEIAALFDTGSLRWITISDGTNTNRVAIYLFNSGNTIAAQVRVASSDKMRNDNIPVTSALDFNKILVNYKENDFSVWINGTKVLTDTSGTTFPADTLNNLSFHSGNVSQGQNFEGEVKAVKTFKAPLNDTQSQNITTTGEI